MIFVYLTGYYMICSRLLDSKYRLGSFDQLLFGAFGNTQSDLIIILLCQYLQSEPSDISIQDIHARVGR